MKSFVATLATVATLFASLAVAVPQVNGAPVEHPPTTNWKCGGMFNHLLATYSNTYLVSSCFFFFQCSETNLYRSSLHSK